MNSNLDHELAELAKSFGPQWAELNNRVTGDLQEREISKHALKTGDKIPAFSLPNAEGKLHRIMNFKGKKYLVISFYRGQWCPFCNLELKALQRELSSLESIPSLLVAISPQTPDKTRETQQKHQLGFEVLSDVGNKVAKQFKLVYTVPDFLSKVMLEGGLDILDYNGKGNLELPMPATYVVGSDGIILKHFVHEDATKRLDPKAVTAFLKSL